jgi:hypothetical protein
MTPPDEMDLTTYLQTEGRRLAALLSAAAKAEPQPLQADADGGQGSPKCLSEVLQGMGVVRNPSPRGAKPPRPPSVPGAAAAADRPPPQAQ